jgi:hypothetical protein
MLPIFPFIRAQYRDANEKYMHSLWRWKPQPNRACRDEKFVLKYSHQIKTIYSLACLDRPSPGQAKMSNLK